MAPGVAERIAEHHPALRDAVVQRHAGARMLADNRRICAPLQQHTHRGACTRATKLTPLWTT